MEILKISNSKEVFLLLNNKVEICGVNTSKLPVLSREEKEELFIKIKAGDEEARTTFIHGNLRLVLSVIQRFYGRGETSKSGNGYPPKSG